MVPLAICEIQSTGAATAPRQEKTETDGIDDGKRHHSPFLLPCSLDSLPP
jgi:hypothetical protein